MKPLKLFLSCFIFLLSGCSVQSQGDSELQEWNDLLSGRVWRHYRSTNIGGNFAYEKTALFFCPDGSALYRDDYNGNEFYGTWSLSRNSKNTPLLTITDQRGESLYFALTFEDSSYYFRGDEYGQDSDPAPCN